MQLKQHHQISKQPMIILYRNVNQSSKAANFPNKIFSKFHQIIINPKGKKNQNFQIVWNKEKRYVKRLT